MPPRAMWKGAISFGLVTIPVAVYPATEEKSLKFNQLHDKDMGRIRYKRVCSIDNEEVEFEHIVKGYEVEKDRYVIITDEDLDAVLGVVQEVGVDHDAAGEHPARPELAADLIHRLGVLGRVHIRRDDVETLWAEVAVDVRDVGAHRGAGPLVEFLVDAERAGDQAASTAIQMRDGKH